MSGRSHARATPTASRFELERFELVDGERYEVEGRWSGVRGRVFMRPELTLSDGHQSRRLLADLAHKPWQAAEGDRWTVAFPCGGPTVEPRDVELSVAPDITVPVKRGSRTRASGARRTSEAPAQQRKPRRARGSSVPPPEAADKAGKRRGLGVQLAEARSALEQLHKEQTRLSGRLDAAAQRAEQTRDELERAYRHRDRLAGERDEAIRARDDARAERDRAIRDAEQGLKLVQRGRDEALDELATLRGELERAQTALQAVASERDAAIRAGVEVERELHAAHTERRHLREQLNEQRATSQSEPAGPATAAIASRTEPHQTPAQHPPAAPEPEPASTSDFSWNEADRWQHSSHPRLRTRAIAFIALVAAVIVVLLILVPLIS